MLVLREAVWKSNDVDRTAVAEAVREAIGLAALDQVTMFDYYDKRSIFDKIQLGRNTFFDKAILISIPGKKHCYCYNQLGHLARDCKKPGNVPAQLTYSMVCSISDDPSERPPEDYDQDSTLPRPLAPARAFKGPASALDGATSSGQCATCI